MHRRPVALLAALLIGLLVLAPGVAAADETPTPSVPTPTSSASSPAGTTAAQPPDAEYYVAVTLIDSSKKTAEGTGQPVPGVTLTVETSTGTAVGSAVTDIDGRAFIAIDGGGKYKVVLDEKSLPEGVKLSGNASTEKAIQVFLEGATNVQFQIGVTTADSVPFLDRFAQALIKGLKLGLIIALAGLGLSLIFGTTGLTNFAHGELITFGALATYMFNRGFGLPVILSGALAVVVSGVFGYVQDKGLWGPLRRRGTGLIAMMIVSIGMAILLRYLFQYIFGGRTRTLSDYVAQAPNRWGPIKVADKELLIMAVAVVAITVVCIAMMTTRLGKAMRAVADNPALAASSGMRVDGVITSVWVLGTALTGLAGVLLAVDRQVQFTMGFKLLLLVFAAITLGGLGTIWGSLIGSLIIGIFVEAAPTISIFGYQPVPDSIKEVGALLVLILILLVRPQGILGRAQRIG